MGQADVHPTTTEIDEDFADMTPAEILFEMEEAQRQAECFARALIMMGDGENIPEDETAAISEVGLELEGRLHRIRRQRDAAWHLLREAKDAEQRNAGAPTDEESFDADGYIDFLRS